MVTFRVEAPYNVDDWTCEIRFVRTDGYEPDAKTASYKSNVSIDVNGDIQTWYRYEFSLGGDVTYIKNGIANGTLSASVVSEMV